MNIIDNITDATRNSEIEWNRTSSYLAFSTRFNRKMYMIVFDMVGTCIYTMNDSYDFVEMEEFRDTEVLKNLYSLIIEKYPEFRENVARCLRNARESEAEDEHLKKKINITPELAGRLDGKCFLDLDMIERIEAFRFVKTSTGIDMISVGCDDHWGYSYLWHDDYGEYEINDTFCGIWIDMVEANSFLVREITQEKFDKANVIVNEVMDKAEKREAEFKRKQKEFGLLG